GGGGRSATPGSTRPLVDVHIHALSTRGGRPPGVHEVGVHVRYGEFFTFLGPPKSGKSDVLRAIAGFLPMTSGRILVDGQDISLLPPRGRGVGYVFQEGALWPHLTVAQHIGFGLEQQGLAATEIARKTETVARRLGLAGLEGRRPPELSIEARRRLAIARALAVAPRGRGVGYVFQEGALWPHLTVAQHIGFGLEQQGLAATEIARKTETVARRLGLAGLEGRRPPELSIEARRRLAIARALAVEPRV